MDNKVSNIDNVSKWKQTGDEEKQTAVHEEMKRMNQLPGNSTYASHRLRVLQKVLQLMSIQVSVVPWNLEACLSEYCYNQVSPL